jgi:hypothetical protein
VISITRRKGWRTVAPDTDKLTKSAFCPVIVTVFCPVTPLPSVAVAITLIVPFVMGVRTPSELMDATEVLLTLQETALISALAGEQVAVYVAVCLFVVIELLPYS